MTKRFEGNGRNKAEYTKTRRCCRNAPLILYILPYFCIVVSGAERLLGKLFWFGRIDAVMYLSVIIRLLYDILRHCFHLCMERHKSVSL